MRPKDVEQAGARDARDLAEAARVRRLARTNLIVSRVLGGAYLTFGLGCAAFVVATGHAGLAYAPLLFGAAGVTSAAILDRSNRALLRRLGDS
jgi:hypothetical protein